MSARARWPAGIAACISFFPFCPPRKPTPHTHTHTHPPESIFVVHVRSLCPGHPSCPRRPVNKTYNRKTLRPGDHSLPWTKHLKPFHDHVMANITIEKKVRSRVLSNFMRARAYVCVCVYELAQVKAARALKDVAIYVPPPPFRVRVCVFLCARTDSVSRPECGGGGVGWRWWWYHTAGPRALQVPPPPIAARSVHLCAGIVTMAGTATGPCPGSAPPYSCPR